MPETLVVDCSVAAKWVMREPDRDRALAFLDRYISGEIVLLAPSLLLAEFARLLSKRARRNQITGAQARVAFALMEQCAPRLALADEHDCALLTADLRLFRNSASKHIRVLRLT